MNPQEPLRGMQRDLRGWWWTIAAAGFTAGVGVLAFPGTAPVRPVVVGWLALFAIIGIYQRRQTIWPRQPRAGADVGEIDSYRRALERRRDEQLRWPARRLHWIVGTVTVAFLLGLVRLAAPGAGIRFGDLFVGPVAVAAVAFAMYAFTRRLTNRAAAAFQRELDDVAPKRPAGRD